MTNSLHSFVFKGNNIFELDRLIIPVNIENTHWFVICVFFRERKIQAYDTGPVKNGRLHYINAVFLYLKMKYKEFHGKTIPDPTGWTKVPCFDGNKIVPLQEDNRNNCGLFTCLIMELLINKIDPWILNEYQLDVETRGRVALFHAITTNKPVFQNCYSQSNLSIQRCKNAPYNSVDIIPLTSALVDRAKCPYIEEIAYHLRCRTVEGTADTPPSKLPRPWDFVFMPQELNDGVVWSYDQSQRIVTGIFTNVTSIHWRHKQYIAEIMERDDLTIIMEGLVTNLCRKMAGLGLLRKQLLLDIGNQTYHNIRRFDRAKVGNFVKYTAKDAAVTSMTGKDYVNYLRLIGESPMSPFAYRNDDGKKVQLKRAMDVAFYMKDVDMTRHLLKISAAFDSEFKMKEILPGGEWCATNSVSCTVAD